MIHAKVSLSELKFLINRPLCLINTLACLYLFGYAKTAFRSIVRYYAPSLFKKQRRCLNNMKSELYGHSKIEYFRINQHYFWLLFGNSG